MRMPIKSRQTQQGMVLVVGLILLLALTLIGISAMNIAKIEFMMAGNQQATIASLQVAENAAATGEDNVPGNGAPSGQIDFANEVGWYEGSALDPINGIDWTGTSGLIATSSNEKYLTEYVGAFSSEDGNQDASNTYAGTGVNRYVFRVTAMGSSGKGGQRYVQTVYATRD